MASRGVWQESESTSNGLDYSYRQTIESHYQVAARAKQSLKSQFWLETGISIVNARLPGLMKLPV